MGRRFNRRNSTKCYFTSASPTSNCKTACKWRSKSQITHTKGSYEWMKEFESLQQVQKNIKDLNDAR